MRVIAPLGGVFTLDAGLSDEEGSDDAVDDLQHGCEQCGMHGE